jgi:succinoglycan biosynthesis protein ExoO
MDTTPIVIMREEPDCWISRQVCSADLVRATIVIPTFDADATLERAVRSALDQSLRDIEIIIVDDASRDSSWRLIESLLREDSRIRAVRNKRNLGKPVGMNRAIALARGEWLAVLDADDWFDPDRLANLIAAGERHGVDMVADNQVFHDGPANKAVGTAWPPGECMWELIFDDFLTGSDAYETFNLGMLKPVMRMDFIRRTALGYEETARHGQDFFHLLQFFLYGGRAVISDTPSYYYTQPFGAVSRQWSHAGRRRYDFMTAYTINRRYLADAADILTPSQTVRLKSRNARLKSLEHYYRAKERVAEGKIPAAIAQIIRHPEILSYLLRRLRKRRPGSALVARVADGARRKMETP